MLHIELVVGQGAKDLGCLTIANPATFRSSTAIVLVSATVQDLPYVLRIDLENAAESEGILP